MEGETRCSGSRLSDNVTTACICVVTEWKWVSLKKKKKKKKKKFFFFFFRETPTSPLVPFRAKFRPLGQPFRPSRPLGWSLIIVINPVVLNVLRTALLIFPPTNLQYLSCKWSRKQSGSWSDGFVRSHLIWIYIVFNNISDQENARANKENSISAF